MRWCGVSSLVIDRSVSIGRCMSTVNLGIGIGVADWRLLRDTADEASLLHAFQLCMRSCCQFLRYSSERRRCLLTFDMLSEKSVWGQLPTKDCMRWFSDVNTDLYNRWHMR